MTDIFETFQWALFDTLAILFAFYLADWIGAIVHLKQQLIWVSAISASLSFNLGKEIFFNYLR